MNEITWHLGRSEVGYVPDLSECSDMIVPFPGLDAAGIDEAWVDLVDDRLVLFTFDEDGEIEETDLTDRTLLSVLRLFAEVGKTGPFWAKKA